MKRTLLFNLIFSFVLILISACTTTPPNKDEVYTRITDGELKAGSAIPIASDDVILTVTGKIGAANVDDSIQMDLATIESVGLVDYTVDDPFEKTSITYRGVLMSDLLDVWQVAKDATTLNMIALNDYAVEVPISDLRKYPILFAVQADGEYMPVSTRGPAMLVYPYNDFEFDVAIYNDYWIWQIKEIEVG